MNSFKFILYKLFLQYKIMYMAFNIEMIEKVYQQIKNKVDKARKINQNPLTLSEKILYSHLWNSELNSPFKRGEDYVDFAPDRIACQDATAQMAI